MIPKLKKRKEWRGGWNGLARELMQIALMFIKIALDHGSQKVSASLQFSRKTEFCDVPRCYKFATFNYRMQSSQTNLDAILN